MSRRRELRVEGQAEPISHFTDAVQAGELLFVSGIVPVDERRELVGKDDVVAQARCVFENMRQVLAAGGCTFSDVVKVTVYLTDITDRPLVNPVRREVFGATRPASTLVEVRALVIPGARIEVDAVALIP
jgi:reactive intermediate/imine deaminase